VKRLLIPRTRKTLSCISAAICLFAVGQGFACTQHASFRSYGQEQGLGNLSVQAIEQDQQGFLWVATQAGLYRYDGNSFENMNSMFVGPPGMLTQLFRSSTGQLWAGGASGLFYIESGHFHAVTVDGKPLPLSTNSRMAEYNGSPAVVSGGDLFLLGNQKQQSGSDRWSVLHFASAFPDIRLPRPITGITTDTKGTLWMGCGAGICRLTGKSLTVFGTKDGIPKDRYNSLTATSGKAVWARGINHILKYVPGGPQSIWSDQSKLIGEAKLSNFFHTMVEDGEGNLLTPLVDGLGILTTSECQDFGIDHGLPSTDIAAIYRDNTGDIWIGLQGRGLLKWKGYGNWESFTRMEGLPSDVVWGIQPDGSGGIFFGTNQGIAHLPAGYRKALPVPGAAAVHGAVYGLTTAPDGSLWFATDHMLFRMQKGHITSINMPDGTGRLTSDGTSLWMATLNGLFFRRFSDPGMNMQRYGQLDKQSIGQLANLPNGEKWAVTSEGIYHLGPWGARRVKLLAGDNRFNSITVDKQGNLWVGGAFSGVSKLRVVNDAVVSRVNIQSPVIGSQQIDEMMVDHRGWLWLAGDHGLDIYHDGHWSSLTEEDGLVWNDINSSALLEASDGSIYIGTSGGLSHLLHPEMALSPINSRVVILGLEYAGQPLDVTSSPEIYSGKGVLKIHVGSTELHNEQAVVIKYHAAGLMEEWIPTTGNWVRFVSSEPRHTDFQFRLESVSGRILSPVSTVSVTALPPWWRTNIAYFVYVLMLAGLVAAGWYWRTRHLRTRHHELERLIASRTAELAEKNQALEATRQELQIKATFDALTGLYNRGAFIELLEREMNRARREGSPMVLGICDVDHFKQVNDKYGHLFGDDVLVTVAKRLSQTLRDYDICGRYGGEEMILLLPGIDKKRAEERIQQVQTALSTEYYCVEEVCIPLTVSIGFAALEENDDTRSLLFRADTALYRAKAEGRNCVRFEGIRADQDAQKE
jgi:diguanylate cyclase (GGDEF)-like protein